MIWLFGSLFLLVQSVSEPARSREVEPADRTCPASANRLHLEGQVTNQRGEGLAGVEVQQFRELGVGACFLGETRTGPGGRYQLELGVGEVNEVAPRTEEV